MKTTNIPAGSQRMSDVGLVWAQEFAAGTGTFEVQHQGSVRIHAITGPVTVTIGASSVALTLEAGETEVINVGTGDAGDSKTTVTVTIAGGSSNVSVAKEKESGRRTK